MIEDLSEAQRQYLEGELARMRSVVTLFRQEAQRVEDPGFRGFSELMGTYLQQCADDLAAGHCFGVLREAGQRDPMPEWRKRILDRQVEAVFGLA